MDIFVCIGMLYYFFKLILKAGTIKEKLIAFGITIIFISLLVTSVLEDIPENDLIIPAFFIANLTLFLILLINILKKIQNNHYIENFKEKIISFPNFFKGKLKTENTDITSDSESDDNTVIIQDFISPETMNIELPEKEVDSTVDLCFNKYKENCVYPEIEKDIKQSESKREKEMTPDELNKLINFAENTSREKNIEDLRELTIQFIEKSRSEVTWFYNYIYDYDINIENVKLLLDDCEIRFLVTYNEGISVNQFKRTKNELAEYTGAKYIKFDFTPNSDINNGRCINIIIPLSLSIKCLMNGIYQTANM